MNGEENKSARENPIQLVTFRLGRERYGITVGKVKEIIRPMEACPIPGMAGPVEGVINLRGEIIPVLRINEILGVEAGEEICARRRRVIILESGSGGFGISVDEVMEVIKVESGMIRPSPEVGAERRCGKAILGIVDLAGTMAICLDPGALVVESLAGEELATT